MAKEKIALNLALGAAMRSARLRVGETQRTLATRAGLDASHYGALERGESGPTYEALLKLADALAIPLHVLLESAAIALDEPQGGSR
jgi:transcriptional regulator with XRE-family HTH domain